MKNQTILCDVKVCKHNNTTDCKCKLSEITVVPMTTDKSAHFCQDYEHK